MDNNEKNYIKKRLYYAVEIKLASPLCVSGGENENTDKDVFRDGNGDCVVPGTSIAGALKSELQSDEKKLMGENKMSAISIADLELKTSTVSVRDGVKLNRDKQVDNKFDMEIVETGAAGTLYISCMARNEPEIEKDKAIITKLLAYINNGTIRFGANKNRGYGRMQIKKVYEAEFSAADLEQFRKFDRKDVSSYTPWLDLEALKEEPEKKFVTICVPLRLTGGISIRKPSMKPNEADFEHLTLKDGRPVIPGSSWNGAVRAEVLDILMMLHYDRAGDVVKQWFGYVDLDKPVDSKYDSQSSAVVFGESIIKGGNSLTMTRNKINRFDASTMDGALYTERSWFGGITTLEIKVQKDVERHYEALIGALLIAIKDIQNGFLSIGGQVAVGRGIFEQNGDHNISKEYEKKYMEALYQFVEGQDGLQ